MAGEGEDCGEGADGEAGVNEVYGDGEDGMEDGQEGRDGAEEEGGGAEEEDEEEGGGQQDNGDRKVCQNTRHTVCPISLAPANNS